MPLDWVLDGDKGENLSLAILDAIEEDFLREVKVARLKTKCWKELRNLKSSVNYGDASTSSWREKGQTHVL
jgi:hypothetical protein